MLEVPRGDSLLHGRVGDDDTIEEVVPHVCSTAGNPNGFARAYTKSTFHLGRLALKCATAALNAGYLFSRTAQSHKKLSIRAQS